MRDQHATPRRRPPCLVAAAIVGVVATPAACACSTATGDETPRAADATTSDRPLSTSPSPSAGVRLAVRMAGTIGCARFPYGCIAVLSVLPPGTTIADSWRPPTTDPIWAPDYTGYSADHLMANPDRELPTLAAGRHLVVVSLLGSSDLVSLNPDGTIATELLARCSVPADVRAGSPPLSLVVTFVRSETSFGGTCSIELRQP